MYFVIVVLLLLVLPAASVILEAVLAPHGVSTMALQMVRVLVLRRTALGIHA